MARKHIKKKRERRSAPQVNRNIVASVAPWLLVNNWNHMVVDDEFVRTDVVSSWTNKLPLGWGEWLMTFDDTVRSALILRRRSGDALRRNLARTINDESWSADKIRESPIDRRQHEYEAEQASEAIDMIVRSNARIFESYLYLQTRAGSEEELNDNEQAVREHMNQKTLDVTAHYANQEQMFWASSPFMLEDPVLSELYNYSMPSMTVARGLLNRDNGLCDPKGMPIGVDDFGGKVVLDILTKTSERPNNNIAVVSESGQGKSTLLKRFILWLAILFGADVICNDIDSEYGYFFKKLGGQVTDMNLNPFVPRNIASAAGDEGPDGTDEEVRIAHEKAMEARVLSTHLPFLVSYLVLRFHLDTARHKDLLEMACERAYARKGVSGSMTFAQYHRQNPAVPGLADVYAELPGLRRDHEDAIEQIQEIERSLYRGVEGVDKHLWEFAEDSIPEDPHLLCIDMNLSSDREVAAAQYYNVLSWEWDLMRSRRYTGRPLFVVTDEVHVLFRDVNAAYMLKDAVQRARKYGAGWVVSTQMISDLMRPEVRDAGEGVIANSTYRFYSKAEGNLESKEPNNAQYVQSLLKATPETMQDLASVGRGKFIVQAGNKETWVNVSLEDWERELFGRGGGE